MERDYKIYDLRGFCNLQDDCSKCRLDALTDNCDFDELPDKKIDQLYKIVEKIMHKGTEENSITEELTGVVKDVNKGSKTVTSILGEIKKEMCDEYCVHAKLTPNFQKEAEETCNRCPLNRLQKEKIMTITQITEKLKSPEFDFLKTDPHLGDHIILLGLGGSYAYGTNIETSDLDIRGCAVNRKEEILTNKNFEQRCDKTTDTTIYSLNKLISLLSNCNPNTIELLGLKPEHYLYVSPIGQELLDHKKMFLSKKAVQSFCGYAYSRLRRLDNKAARKTSQAEKEQHILNSIKNASYDFQEKYFSYPDDAIKLYIEKSEREELDSEIFMDICLSHYPLRDYKGMWSEMNNIVKDYAKIGKRNKNAAEHGKLSKHMMHLVRLYLMGIDLLEKEEIITYREKDHDFLMSIRDGKYLDKNDQPTKEFFEIVDDLQKRFEAAAENTKLPAQPDYKKINEFLANVNERVVKGEYLYGN